MSLLLKGILIGLLFGVPVGAVGAMTVQEGGCDGDIFVGIKPTWPLAVKYTLQATGYLTLANQFDRKFGGAGCFTILINL